MAKESKFLFLFLSLTCGLAVATDKEEKVVPLVSQPIPVVESKPLISSGKKIQASLEAMKALGAGTLAIASLYWGYTILKEGFENCVLPQSNLLRASKDAYIVSTFVAALWGSAYVMGNYLRDSLKKLKLVQDEKTL